MKLETINQPCEIDKLCQLSEIRDGCNILPAIIPSGQGDGMKVRNDYVLVIPAHNESSTIRKVVNCALLHIGTVIVVDDGSTDGTVKELLNLPITLLQHTENLGKAASLWNGMQAGLKLGANGIVTMDGDGQHDPADLPRLLMAAETHPDKLVIGSRLWNRDVIPKARYWANRFANFWIAWASGQALEDSQSGFRGYPTQLIQLCRLEVSRDRSFVFESEIIIEAARHKFLCVFLPVQTIYPENARPSHFRPVRDIVSITRMVAWRLFNHGFFLPGLWRSLSGDQSLKPRKL
jgi:glycosyltransferase involved in cell wall biosynthesis